jgi:ABC-type nitrate/sulfonate/bicarbonate transport system permease component
MDAMSHAEHHIETAQLRRSPRYGVFLIGGGVLGILVALVLTLVFGDPTATGDGTGVKYSTGQAFGFLALVGLPVGIALGGLVALVLDRVVGRRTRRVRVDHETVTDPES